MRFKILILSSLLFLAFLAVTALCVNWDNPNYNADEMISAGEDMHISSPEITPWVSRERQKNKSSLDWTMPSTLTGGGASAKESRTEAESSSEEAAAATTNETAKYANTSDATETELPPAEPEVTNVSGNWYFTLNDSVERNLALILFQKKNEVFGSGKMKEGNNTMDVTVSGALANANLELNLVSANPITQYKLNLNLSQDLATGEYQASSAIGETWTGTAEGQKIS